MIDRLVALLRMYVHYFIPSLAALWLIWTAFELKWMQGWFDAQDEMRGASRPFYNLPIGGLLLACGMVVLSLYLARSSRRRSASVLGILAILFTEVIWLGSTG